MQGRRTFRRMLVAGVALAATVPLAAAAPATATESAAGRAVAPIAWTECADAPAFDCATYPVPLDYDRPHGDTIRLALTRRPADDPARKVGSLFLNPGGPGGAGLGFARAASEVLFDDEIRARFDIVGFDPRGVGASAPIQCFRTDEEWEQVVGPVPSVPLSRAEIDATLAAYRTWTSACARNGGPLLHHLSTLDVAKDLDLLRAAAGDRQLTYAGYSYGTLIGATYANLFPGRVRALLLDGMVDPAERTQRSLANELNRAGGFETALRGFFDLCADSGAACAFSAGGDPAAKWVQLRTRLRQGPLAVPELAAEVTISEVTDFVARRLYDPTAFVDLADILRLLYAAAVEPAAERAATTRRAGGGLAALAGGGRRGLADAYSYNDVDTLFAVNCVDKRLPRGQAVWPPIARGFELVHPTFGRYQAFSAAVCGTWPVVTNERYAGPWDRITSEPVLVVGTRFDPATPYAFARRATRELGRARLLTLDGYGHTSILASTCIDEKTNAYLLTSRVPPAGTVCAPDVQPFDPAAATAGSDRARLPELGGRGR